MDSERGLQKGSRFGAWGVGFRATGFVCTLSMIQVCLNGSFRKEGTPI